MLALKLITPLLGVSQVCAETLLNRNLANPDELTGEKFDFQSIFGESVAKFLF
jgi:hypothetical protein